MATSKMFDDFRIYFFITYCVIAGIIFCIIKNPIFDNSLNLDKIDFYYKTSWCLTFALLGFSLLILKVCINGLHDIKENGANQNANAIKESQETTKIKRQWRYLTYYPIMLVVLSFLSTTISIYQFKLTKPLYFEASALLAFFLGYFVDSLPNLIEKFGDKG